MSAAETALDIEAAAARWAVRIDAAPADAALARALDAWLTGDPRRRGALLRAQAALALLDRGSVVRTMIAPPRPRPVGLLRRGRRAIWRAGGACAAAALVAVLSVQLARPSPDRIETAVGEIRRVALKDGSVATVNTDSDVEVRLARAERHIRLVRGEAWFQVAKDAARPFIVDAGPVHVRATGTAFSVRRDDGRVRVVVTEGRVIAWRDGYAQRRLAVSAGEEARLSEADVAPPPAAAAARTQDALAWRTGEIVLDGETVAEAAAEFNRYNERKIVVHDPAVGGRKVVGYFLLNQPETFARMASALGGGSMKQNGNRIVIE